MKLLIRADANTKIASGHVKRCEAIADAFSQQAVEVVFVVSDYEAKKVINNDAYRCIVLNNDYKKKDQELAQICGIICKEKANGILIDSYEITEKYLLEISKICAVAYIATYKPIDFHGKMIINYAQKGKINFFKTKYNELYRSGYLLQGDQYVPLRKEFADIKNKHIQQVERVLITTGGSDPDKMAETIFLACMQCDKLKVKKFTIVVGKYFRYAEELEKISKEYSQLQLEYDVRNMAELMEKHDIAVSAGGISLFEVCACGIPTICFSMADNQIGMANYFDEKGCVIYAGDEREDKISVVKNIVEQLSYWLKHIAELNYLSTKMKKRVDGKGASRIADKLMHMMEESIE